MLTAASEHTSDKHIVYAENIMENYYGIFLQVLYFCKVRAVTDRCGDGKLTGEYTWTDNK